MKFIYMENDQLFYQLQNKYHYKDWQHFNDKIVHAHNTSRIARICCAAFNIKKSDSHVVKTLL